MRYNEIVCDVCAAKSDPSPAYGKRDPAWLIVILRRDCKESDDDETMCSFDVCPTCHQPDQIFKALLAKMGRRR